MAIIGREPGADIVVADAGVSARHAFVELLTQNRFRVVDLGSANGTYVNSTGDGGNPGFTAFMPSFVAFPEAVDKLTEAIAQMVGLLAPKIVDNSERLDSVEEKIVSLQQKKKSMANDVLDGKDTDMLANSKPTLEDFKILLGS